MQQFKYPTLIFFGEGALIALAERMRGTVRKVLIVTDATLVKVGISAQVEAALIEKGIATVVFDGTHANPVEEDVEKGLSAYQMNGCDALVALGGGSPMDTAKVIRLLSVHPGPLAKYDDAKGGDKLIKHAMPPLYAIPITAATGIDAFTHCLEAYMVNAFHPLADGIAQEGLRLILKNLPTAFAQGADLEAQGAMLMAAAMGATAFQKGLGMTHSLAHPLSARYNTHHGLANALLLPDSLAFLESRSLPKVGQDKLSRAQELFREAGLAQATLSESCRYFFTGLGVRFGLRHHHVPKEDLEIKSVPDLFA